MQNPCFMNFVTLDVRCWCIKQVALGLNQTIKNENQQALEICMILIGKMYFLKLTFDDQNVFLVKYHSKARVRLISMTITGVMTSVNIFNFYKFHSNGADFA